MTNERFVPQDGSITEPGLLMRDGDQDKVEQLDADSAYMLKLMTQKHDLHHPLNSKWIRNGRAISTVLFHPVTEAVFEEEVAQYIVDLHNSQFKA